MRRRVASSLAAAAALCALALPASAVARDDRVTEADVSMRLAPDAALLVTETLTFEYDGSFQASYRDILLKKGETITNVSVEEGKRVYQPGGCTVFGCTDAEGRFGAAQIPEGGGVRIVWHHQASSETRTFTIAYRVEDAVVAYDDVIDLVWQVWGDQWEDDLPTLTAELRDPALDPNDPLYRVWGKPREVEGESFRDPAVARLEASDVHAGQFVEMRVTIPRTPGQGVGAARRGEGDGLPGILKEEEENDENFNSPFNKAKRWVSAHALTLALILGGLAVLAMMVLGRLAREHSTSVPKHVPEPPDDASPALAYGLAHEGGDSTDTVLATLLDLVDREYYTDKTVTAEEEKLDLSIAKNSKRPSGKLELHEQEVLSFFDELIEGDTVPMSEMKDRIPEHDSTWRGRWESMTAALDAADEGQLSWDRNLNKWRLLMVLPLIVGFGVIALARLSVEEDWTWIVPAAVGLVTVIVVFAWPWRNLKRLAPEYGERSAKWQAFERWTRDFPSLKDDPPATLELWKRILVFGVAFGTAERMIASGRIPAPVLESSAGWTGYYFSGGGDASFGSSFSSGFSSQVAPESSSSGGGGGFSGGGGGGSGGGGGGSW